MNYFVVVSNTVVCVQWLPSRGSFCRLSQLFLTTIWEIAQEIPVVAKHRIYQSVAPFLSPKIPPWIGRRRRATPRRASPQPSHRVYLSKSALWQCAVASEQRATLALLTTLERKTFASGIHFFPNKYISFAILILRLPLSLFLSRKMQSYMPHPSSLAALGYCCPKQAKRSKKSQKSKGKERKKQSFQLMRLSHPLRQDASCLHLLMIKL